MGSYLTSEELMASRPSTIKKAQRAKSMKRQGREHSTIARALGVSESRVDEYLERNSHSRSCKTCGGTGINKQRSTGKKSAICNQ